MNNPITTTTTIHGPIEKVWEYYTSPDHITKWAFASDDWEAPHATNDLRVGGEFMTRMQSKDGKEGFDFTGRYDQVEEYSLIRYTMSGEDSREVEITFLPKDEDVEVTVTFEMEQENSREMQQAGWQAILDNFKKHVETN